MRWFPENFLGDNKKIDDDLEILHDTNVFKGEVSFVNIFQPLTQESTLRQIEDLLAAIKFKCEQRRQPLVKNTHAILSRVLMDIHKI